jgi:AcrR family transcriptional regulator
MARPKYERDEQTARDRIVEAFWRMVEDGPYDKVSVRGLVRESGVNKNTFYYHFEGIDDLARQATRDALEPELLLEMLSMMQGGAMPARIQSPGFAKRLERVRAIARAKGTPELQDKLKQAIADVWSTALGFVPADLGESQRIALEFALGGIISVLAHANEDGSEPTPDQIASAGVPQAAAIILGSLRAKDAAF